MTPNDATTPAHNMTQSLRETARHLLAIAEPTEKVGAVWAMVVETYHVDTEALLVASTAAAPLPGRSAQPTLIAPQDVPRRSMSTVAGRAAMIHALAHIELNAVNLALDIVWRFAGMPEAFYRDWARVAVEEATHFTLLNEHLQKLGFAYGDFAAHNGLWEMAEKTRDDLLARLALVARTLEARGLDVSPMLRDKLRGAGDLAAAAILEVILRDEIGHVAIGSRWYQFLCDADGLDPITTAANLAKRYAAPAPRGPFNLPARRAAGFSEAELAALNAALAGEARQPIK